MNLNNFCLKSKPTPSQTTTSFYWIQGPDGREGVKKLQALFRDKGNILYTTFLFIMQFEMGLLTSWPSLPTQCPIRNTEFLIGFSSTPSHPDRTKSHYLQCFFFEGFPYPNNINEKIYPFHSQTRTQFLKIWNNAVCTYTYIQIQIFAFSDSIFFYQLNNTHSLSWLLQASESKSLVDFADCSSHSYHSRIE